MDVTSDGRTAVLLTYAHAYQFRRNLDETWSEALERGPREIALPPRRQGEAICFAADNKALFLTSERLPTPLWRVPWSSSADLREGKDDLP